MSQTSPISRTSSPDQAGRARLNFGEPAAPRRAATVVVTRTSAAGALEIFMVRRSSRSAFMPDAMVFPGGKVDPEDGPEGSDEAFETAARRECREEIGVDLGARALRWFDTWLTPSVEPRRYLARFYVTRVERDASARASADGHETHDGRWASAQTFLDACTRGEIELPPPTICTLLRLTDPTWPARVETAPEFTASALRTPILPKWAYVDGRIAGSDDDGHHHVYLPHDDEYEQIAGEGAGAPGRVQTLPTRFVRVGAIWRTP